MPRSGRPSGTRSTAIVTSARLLSSGRLAYSSVVVRKLWFEITRDIEVSAAQIGRARSRLSPGTTTTTLRRREERTMAQASLSTARQSPSQVSCRCSVAPSS